MKKILIVIFSAIIVFLGGNYASDGELGWGGGGGGDLYITKDYVYGTTTVPACKRDVTQGYAEATSTDTPFHPTVWWCASSTDNTGTPWLILDADTGRQDAGICVTQGNMDFWLRNSTTTSKYNLPVTTGKAGSVIDRTEATTTLAWGTGYNLTTGECWHMREKGEKVWPGKIYGISSSTATYGTSSVMYWYSTESKSY